MTNQLIQILEKTVSPGKSIQSCDASEHCVAVKATHVVARIVGSTVTSLSRRPPVVVLR